MNPLVKLNFESGIATGVQIPAPPVGNTIESRARHRPRSQGAEVRGNLGRRNSDEKAEEEKNVRTHDPIGLNR